MAKFCSLVAIIGVSLVLVVAEPPLLTQSRILSNLRIQSNSKLFARQERVLDAVPSSAPYPPSGVTPEIPFDLPTETEAPLSEPDQTYGPPEKTPVETYLPPEATPDLAYGPPKPKPDQTYGPPEPEDAITEPTRTYSSTSTDNQPAIKESDAEELPPTASNSVSENLIQPRKNFKVHSRSGKLRSRAPAQISRSSALQLRRVLAQPRFNTVSIIHSEPVLIYTLH